MEKLMTRQAFSKALLAARTQRHSGAHPFSLAWADGKLTRAQLGFWAVQHYYYIEQIPQQFGHLFCRLPDLDARHHMLENLIGEEVPDKQGKRHPDLLLKFAQACGVSPRRVSEAADRGNILPGTRAMRSWIYELVAFRELAEAAAGIMVALEGQTPTLYPKYVEACRAMGMNDDDLEFFHVHIENDSHHEGEGLQITYRYAHTPALQLKAVAAVAASARQRLAMLDGIWSAIETGDWKLRQKARGT